MASVEAGFSVLSSSPLLSAKSRFQLKPSFSLYYPRISTCFSTYSLKYHSHLQPLHPIKLGQNLRCAVEEIAVEQAQEEQDAAINQKRKLFVFNLPWSFSVADVKTLFGQCGTVVDVEVINRVNKRSRSYIFVTMASGEEAQAVITMFNSQEVSGRILQIEYAKGLKKPPSPPSPTDLAEGETRHYLYVSNLAWKARSTDLRNLLESKSKPTSARVVFAESPGGKSAGYGFVSYATREEAEAAISEFNGQELLGRPITLKFSVRKDDESGKSEEGIEPEES